MGKKPKGTFGNRGNLSSRGFCGIPLSAFSRRKEFWLSIENQPKNLLEMHFLPLKDFLALREGLKFETREFYH